MFSGLKQIKAVQSSLPTFIIFCEESSFFSAKIKTTRTRKFLSQIKFKNYNFEFVILFITVSWIYILINTGKCVIFFFLKVLVM